jgi:uncharacterized membrane protein
MVCFGVFYFYNYVGVHSLVGVDLCHMVDVNQVVCFVFDVRRSESEGSVTYSAAPIRSITLYIFLSFLVICCSACPVAVAAHITLYLYSDCCCNKILFFHFGS